MPSPLRMPLRALAALALAAGLGLALPAYAGRDGAPVRVPAAPPASVAVETYAGVVETLLVEDRVLGATARHYTLRLADGRALALRDVDGRTLVDGSLVSVSGRRNQDHLFVTSVASEASPKALASSPSDTAEGELEFLYADDLAAGRWDLMLSLLQPDGSRTPVKLASLPSGLEPGMKVRAQGRRDADGRALVASRLTIVEWGATDATPKALARTAADAASIEPKAMQNTSVLVVLLKFSDTPLGDAFVTNTTPAKVNDAVFASSTSAAAYYREVSYGTHQLSGTVTAWLTAGFAMPSTCDYSGIASEAQRLATNAGYNPSSYQKRVYIFPNIAACQWSGLGGGSSAWINGTTALLVIGHELGHTFGLGHASSIGCSGQALAPNCSRNEYGDAFEIMGNSRAMHFSAAHKDDLGYLPAGTVKTHRSGTTTYTLQPLETTGASTYAVKVEASPTRTYWLEYRQATGFDAGIAGYPVLTNGAFVHLGYPNDYGCDTCLLDMVPGTGTLADAALEVGRSFVDADTGTTISTISRGAAGLTVTVARPPSSTHMAVYRPSGSAFLVDYQFDHVPDARVVFGAPGDVPVVGRFGTDGLMSLAVYRGGRWFLDTNRDGSVDRSLAFGGAAGDVPLAAAISTSYADDLVIYRGGYWFVDYASSRDGRVDRTIVFGGNAVDVPLAGDIDGDGLADLVIYRSGIWYIDFNRDGIADKVVRFGGSPGDIPVLVDYDGNGRMDLAIYRGGLWYVTTDLTGTPAAMFGYGGAGDRPLTGGWYR